MAKTGKDLWLRLLGIEDVNDVRNLAPACRRCNRKKGSQAGIWIIKAVLGKHKWYWVLRRVLQILLLFLATALFLEFIP